MTTLSAPRCTNSSSNIEALEQKWAAVKPTTPELDTNRTHVLRHGLHAPLQPWIGIKLPVNSNDKCFSAISRWGGATM
jgi:hypothetical protein